MKHFMNPFMKLFIKHLILSVTTLTLIPTAVQAQPTQPTDTQPTVAQSAARPPRGQVALSTRDERDLSRSGALTEAQLRREPITFQRDVPYAGTGNPRHRLDLYIPKRPRLRRLPIIVFFHGGGWSQGDKSEGAGRLMPLVRTGRYAGISVGYRLSGEAVWPAQIHDAKAAIRWIRANADRYKLDASHIGVWGRSSGGHMALMLGLSGEVPDLEGGIGPHGGVSSKVNAAANFSGVTDIPALIGQPSDINRTRPDAPEALLLGGPLRERAAQARAASPLTYITRNDMPVLTVHGTQDRTVPYDQALRLDKALRNAGVSSYFVTVSGGHGDFGTAADSRVIAFFDRFLLGRRVRISTATINMPVKQPANQPKR